MNTPHSRRAILAYAALALLVSGLACSSGGGGGTTGTGDILIGHYASMTGSEATFGISTDNGIRLAVDEFNAAGGLNGRKIKLITYDDKGDAKEAGSAVTRLVTKDQVAAVIGEVASGLSLAGGPVCQEYGIPMISPSSTNPKVTKIGDMIFRVCFIDPFQGAVCAKFARENEHLKVERAAILYEQTSPYSVGLKDEFEKAFTALGGTITATQSFSKGDQDFSPQLTTIRGGNPQVIFIPAYYTDVGNISIQARKLGLKEPLLGTDGWDSADLAKIAGPAIEGCFYANHYSHQDPSPNVQVFLKKYKERHNATADGLAALGYDAANILFASMKRAKTLGGKDLAAAIAETKDFEGVTGRISLNADRDAVKPAVILEMKGGESVFVTKVNPDD